MAALDGVKRDRQIPSIPGPVLGGITLILYGLIALMGVRIWIDARVDFSDHKNLVIAGASLIAATGLGIKGLTVGGVNIVGIAYGTLLSLVLDLCLSMRGEAAEGGQQDR